MMKGEKSAKCTTKNSPQKSDQKNPHLVEPHSARGYGACDEKNEEIEKKEKGTFIIKKIKTSGKRKVLYLFVFLFFA